MDLKERSLQMHERLRGKLEIKSKIEIKTKEDLSLAYTPGVAEPCKKIHENKENVYKYTGKSNTVAVISDGSAVLGLGNIGAEASIPVMEGKRILYKEVANIDGLPILLYGADPKNITLLDSKGTITKNRKDLNKYKQKLADKISQVKGGLETEIKNTDVFIGVSKPNVLTKEMVKSMNKDPIIFAMANPDPEILPNLAKEAGSKIVATGRSDFPNQINNVLAFPGIFRGALDIRATKITKK